MRRGKKLNVRGWEAAETGGTQARHIELRLRVVSAGREVLLKFLTEWLPIINPLNSLIATAA